ncbi:hypothetical protein UFOVP343_32 [uncultured Caudovirales phage]|uniref:Uncharacterized protein n=1 Tax=uncultured Caudovirales phage TaxID=2100421 RepID=A0A6J5M1P8_9CAUD|nr:hypothetical protein UFOVP343_32 [uncultured Caudovirales phage]
MADVKSNLELAVIALERIANSQPRPKRNGDYDKTDVSALQRVAKVALKTIKGENHV